MNTQPEDMLKPLRSETLQDSEKLAMRRRLQTLQTEMPVRKPSVIRQLWHAYSIPSLSLITKPMIIALILAVSLALGGGVSYAAEQSLPGDALYVVKTSVNEPVRSALTLSAEAKADWKTQLVERRLQEAETLALDGRLSEDLQKAIEEHLNKQVGDVSEAIDHLRSSDKLSSAAEVGAHFEATLRAHEDVLTQIAAVNDGPTDTLNAVVKKHHDDSQELENELDDQELAQQQDENQNDVAKKQEAAEGKMKAAEQKIAEVTDFVAKAKVSDETRVQAQAKLMTVAQTMDTGKSLLAAAKYDEAFETFRKAARDAQDVKVSLAVEQGVQARVRVDLKKEDDERESEMEHRQSESDKKKAEMKRESNERQEESDKKESEHSVDARVNVSEEGNSTDSQKDDESREGVISGSLRVKVESRERD